VNSVKLLLRFLIVGALLLVLLIPLLLIQGTIDERTRYRNDAVHTVGESHAREQQVLGPVLVIPWNEPYRHETKDDEGRVKVELKTRLRHELYLPERLQIEGALAPELRRLGLFKVPVYAWDARLRASFATAPRVEGRDYQPAYLALGIADVRGLSGMPTLRVNGEAIALHPGSQMLESRSLSGGIHAWLPGLDEAQDGASLEVELDFVLAGTRQLSIVPLGDVNDVMLSSSWPHPSFVKGHFLPKHETGADGFNAHWAIPSLATRAQSQLRNGEHLRELEVLRVDLVDPVDVYTLTKRASKYGLLFVVLTFVGFVLFELIQRLRIHPVQYLLVGLALAMFFLLLLSLSEHLPFWQAYLISTIACIGLQGAYLAGVLRQRRYGLAFSGLLGALYAALYLLLQSEGYALLLGSILLFAILAAIMWMTRKLDWYEVGANLR